MSHVTTSAVLSTTGLGSIAVAPEAQLVSNERFHDLLESYVHPELPVHPEAIQKASTAKPQSAKALTSGQTAQSQPLKAESSARAVIEKNDVSRSELHNAIAKQTVAPQNVMQRVGQKAVPESKQAQPQTNDIQKKSLQTPAPNTTDKYSRSEKQSQSQSVLAQAGKSDEAGRDPTLSSVQETGSASAGESGSAPEKMDQKNVSSVTDNTQSAFGSSTSEYQNKKEAVPQDNSENNTEIKENSLLEVPASAESISSAGEGFSGPEKIASEPLEEASSDAQPDSTTATPEEEEKVARSDDQQTLLYQKDSNGIATTHIEMSVGNNDKIHVEIGGADNKEHRIHINTDNPAVYQSLKNDHDTLVAALSESAAPVAATQLTTPVDIQISLSAPSFLDTSSRGERPESNNRSSGSSRGNAAAASTSLTERRFLRGVVDLTV